MAKQKKVYALRKGDIAFYTGKLGVILRVRVTEDREKPEDSKTLVSVWAETGKRIALAWGRKPFEVVFGTLGKDLFINLNDANLAGRAKVQKQVAAAEAKLKELDAILNSPLPVEGVKVNKAA